MIQLTVALYTRIISFLKEDVLGDRLRKGWDLEKAIITTPIIKRKKGE